MSEETKKTSEEQEAEKEIPVTDGDQEEENLTPEGEDLPEEENKTKVAKVTKAQVQEIAELKMKDLNAASIEAAMSMIAGTARSMGIEVVD